MASAASSWVAVARLWAFDLQRFRVAIGCAIGLEIFRAGLVEWLLHRPTRGLALVIGRDGYVHLETFDIFLLVTMGLVTAMLVQADHPTDDRAFWRSRPVAPWQLAVAKLTLLGALFILLPTIVNAARLLAYDAPLAAYLASAVQFSVIGGGVVLPVWALALATRTLSRFIGVAIGLTVAWATAIALLSSYRPVVGIAVRLVGEKWIREDRVAPPLPDWQGVERHGWTFALLMTLGATSCLAGCYRARRPLLPATAALLLVAVPSVLPAPATAGPPDGIDTGPLHLSAPLQLPPRFSIGDRVNPSTTSVGGALPLTGRPANLTYQLRLGAVRVRTGTFAPAAIGVEYCCLTDSPAAALAAAWGKAPPDTAHIPGPGFAFYVDNADAVRLRNRVVDVDATARLQFTRHDLIGELPLRPGQSFRTADHVVEVLDIGPDGKSAHCRVARFPTLTPPWPPLAFFVGDRQAVVVEALPSWRLETTFAEGTARSGARGRSWVALLTLPLDHIIYDAATRLFVVESHPAGELVTTIVGRGVRVIQPATDAEARAR